MTDSAAANASPSLDRPEPPRAEPRASSASHHGISRRDDFAWLRAENWQTVMRDPSVLAHDIRAYLEAENAYAEAMMAPTKALQKTLVKEMRARIKEDDSTPPSPDGPYAYGIRYREGDEHPLIVRTPREGSQETILLDANALAKDKPFFRLGGVAHSRDHSLVAWASDETGSEFHTIRLREVKTGEDRDEAVQATTGSVAWAADGRSFLYVWLDENHRPCRVYRHVLGSAQEDDALIYVEPDPGFFVSVDESLSRRFLIIRSNDHETTELRLLDADQPDAEPRLVAPRITGQEYDIEHSGGLFYILTNAEGAEDFCIKTAPVETPSREYWRDLVPHRPGRLILSHIAFADHLVRLEREDGLPRIVLRRLADGAEHAISFDEQAYSLGLSGGYEHDTTRLRFSYSSMATPSRLYDYDMETRERALLKEQEIPSGYNPAHYITKRLQVRAPDGETVPVSVLHRADLDLATPPPCLLYGYGAYGIVIPASFSTTRLSLVDRGFVYAIAHVRGGKDKGYRWYKQGRGAAKPNTFSDFIVAAEGLVQAGLAARGRIVAQGGSAGGLLMGAVANQAPEGLFGGIIAQVPFVDVLSTMLDETLPLTPPEWPEWGNPITDPEAYRIIAGYSPYDNVRAKSYPPMLILAGLTDPRVTYWEPAKWVAKLRALKSDNNPLLLKTDMSAGHAGKTGRFDALAEIALAYAFAMQSVGPNEAALRETAKASFALSAARP